MDEEPVYGFDIQPGPKLITRYFVCAFMGSNVGKGFIRFMWILQVHMVICLFFLYEYIY